MAEHDKYHYVYFIVDQINKKYTFTWKITTLREESSQTNVILQYKLLASILSAICTVIQQS